ncbi:hypothetical protein [Achromobacter sp.]|uniref:hypothetical protein n=1 Tax=Achromobacter sp. TaxID=134375 RepID=UPI0028A63C2F|nr:hypothetical protein [Achromobacter sp.]
MNHSISLSRLQALLRIAERAVELHKLEDTRRSAQVSLADACRAYRAENALGGYIEKHTPQWDAMMDAVSAEYGVLAGYKKAEYNGKRRLATAVRAYLNGGAK